ncbi:sensor histidine kinase [Larkinella soli]|uniref:sensor histidine kinase n=1 Tax=Larkinella soli TaxID=1770527 RepID=UPI000FFC4007|nr:histidine kinase [Larkinella soli]
MISSRRGTLTLRQKWQLAQSVFVIYWPIRLYMNIDAVDGTFILHMLPFWTLEVTLTLIFFFFWISVSEWLQQRMMKGRGQKALVEIKLPIQVATLVVAFALAGIFNFGFHRIWHGMDAVLQQRFPSLGQPTRSRSPQNRTGQGRSQRDRMNNGLMVMAMLSAFYLADNRRSSLKMRKLETQAERMQKESVQAQFSALKNQVNPHFLFNSLSILSSLVEVDAGLSVQFINRLSRAYRYILEQKDNDRIALKTELEFIEAYIFLLQIRFEDKLQVAVDVPAREATTWSIAPLTLQLLIENAVKHNQMSEEIPLLVSVFIREGYLWVTNPIQLRPHAEATTGVGLQNIINRYGLLTDLPVWAGEQQGTFVVKIPLLP